LLDGVHLPNVVRHRSAVTKGRRFAAGRGGWFAVPTKPTLEGAGAGQVGEFGMQASQTQPHIRSAPRGMLLMQQQGEGQQGRRRGGFAAAVGGPQRCLALRLEGRDEPAHRARCQPELCGNDDGRSLFLPQQEDALAQRAGQGGRHKSSREKEKEIGRLPENSSAPLTAAKPNVAICGQTSCRVTETLALRPQAPPARKLTFPWRRGGFRAGSTLTVTFPVR